jgi:hypothetical protein
MMDVQRLVEWLGPAGATAGVLASKLSLHELIDIARAKGLPLSPKPSRKEVVNELIYYESIKIEKSIDDLLAMSSDALVEYFDEINPSRSEIASLLASLGVTVGSEANRHLFKFAAREISDLGMYQRVARGSHRR